MGKRMAVVMVMVAVVAVSVDVCRCSLGAGVTQDNMNMNKNSPSPSSQDQKSDSWSGGLHDKYTEAFNSDHVNGGDAGRNLMKGAGDTAAKTKDAIGWAYERASNLMDVATDSKDRVIRMVESSPVDSYDLHADWPSDDEDEEVQNGWLKGPGTTSHSKFDQHMARMKRSATDASGFDSDSDGDFIDHITDGIDYGRSRLSNSYDHAKQNVNAGIDKVKEKGTDAKDAVENAMEDGQDRLTHMKDEAIEKVHTAADKAGDEMRAFDESRHKVCGAYESAKERVVEEAKATYESAKEKLAEAVGKKEGEDL